MKQIYLMVLCGMMPACDFDTKPAIQPQHTPTKTVIFYDLSTSVQQHLNTSAQSNLQSKLQSVLMELPLHEGDLVAVSFIHERAIGEALDFQPYTPPKLVMQGLTPNQERKARLLYPALEKKYKTQFMDAVLNQLQGQPSARTTPILETLPMVMKEASAGGDLSVYYISDMKQASPLASVPKTIKNHDEAIKLAKKHWQALVKTYGLTPPKSLPHVRTFILKPTPALQSDASPFLNDYVKGIFSNLGIPVTFLAH